MTPSVQMRRRNPARAAAVGAGALLVLTTVVTAPEPPGYADTWRWAALAVAVPMAGWNLATAYTAYRRTGLVSVIGFLHLWAFLAFSFPAAETTFRYERISIGFWQTPTEDPVVFRAAVLLAAFQVLFFLALGRATEGGLARTVLAGRADRPNPRIAYVFVLLLLPLVLTRLEVLRGLGVAGVAETMVTRTDYFERLASGVGPVTWALNTLFPIYGVSLACLAVKFLVPHPSRRGSWLFVLTLVVFTAGVALSGGRAELVYVLLTVALFMYVQGYRSPRALAPLLVPVACLGALLLLVAQARHGVDNPLSRLAASQQVGYDYVGGDITQILGLGRFDALVLILDRFEPGEALLGASYGYALAGAANTTFLPVIATGTHLPVFTVSSDVLGYWIFGGRLSSALPSAPGELYLNAGLVGLLGGALVLGLLARIVMRSLGQMGGPLELAWLLVVWTVARVLSDESYLMATFVARNWPAMVILGLALARVCPRGSTDAEAPPVPGRVGPLPTVARVRAER